ncbi:MAG TPA: hypothetical protein PLZ42_02410 [Methanothrix sp.]|nr:hypothetical protein [Methanothrix sp.]
MIEGLTATDIAIVSAGYLLLMATSGKLIYSILGYISNGTIHQKIGKEARDTGFVIGKCENLLILTFMLVDAYIALSLIFAGKAVVREEDINKNSLYYLTGTIINVTYSIMVGFIIKIIINIY